MIVLGQYVFKYPDNYHGENRQDYGYFTNVSEVGDWWRADLDAHYNPRHVPVDIGRVSIGTDYAGIVFIDSADSDDPVMVYCYDTWNGTHVLDWWR